MDRDERAAKRRYIQVAELLRRDLHSGTYRDRLPSEMVLARELGVSRGTLRQALGVLARDGALHTVPGRGTYVGSPAAQPNGAGGGMNQRAGLVGMVLPSIVRARTQVLISGAEETLREAGYSFLLATSGDDRKLETEQIRRIVGQGASGLLLYVVDGPMDLPLVREVVAAGLPVVLIDRYVPDLQVDAVTADNLGGAFLAVRHLAEQGFRRVGYVGTDNVTTSSIVERMAGYRWAMQVHGLPVEEDLVYPRVRRLRSWPPRERDLANVRENQELLRRYLEGRGRPEAIFACTDYVAFQVIEAAESLGLQVPRDVALVGFDNVSYEEYHGVPLTTVDQPRFEIGATAASLLLDRLAGRRRRVGRVVVGTRLVVRASSTREAAQPVSMSAPGPRRQRATSKGQREETPV